MGDENKTVYNIIDRSKVKEYGDLEGVSFEYTHLNGIQYVTLTPFVVPPYLSPCEKRIMIDEVKEFFIDNIQLKFDGGK